MQMQRMQRCNTFSRKTFVETVLLLLQLLLFRTSKPTRSLDGKWLLFYLDTENRDEGEKGDKEESSLHSFCCVR